MTKAYSFRYIQELNEWLEDVYKGDIIEIDIKKFHILFFNIDENRNIIILVDGVIY